VSWVTLPTLVPLIYGPSFVSSVTAARLLVLAALVRGLTSWSKVLAFAIGRPGMRLVVTTVDAILLVSATWMFAVHGTLEGVAAAHLTIAVLISGLWLKLAMSVETAGAPREQTGGISATKRDR
jgi:O-antigen/teichoic acid export membrane protein